MADIDDLPGANSAELGNAAFIRDEFVRTRAQFRNVIVRGQDVPYGPTFISVGARPDLYLGTQPFEVSVALYLLFPTDVVPRSVTATQVAQALRVLVPILRAFPGQIGDVPLNRLSSWVKRALRDLQMRGQIARAA